MNGHATLPPCHDIPLGFLWLWDGKEWCEDWLWHDADNEKSIITIAPTRSGKFTDQLGQELAIYGGMIDGIAPSVFVGDKKGELAAVLARARYQLGDRVEIIAPWGIPENASKIPGVNYDAHVNFLAGLTPHHTTDIYNIANGLILAEGSINQHFVKRPRQLVQTLLGYMLDDNELPAELTFLTTLLGMPLKALCDYMKKISESSPIDWVRDLAGGFAEPTEEVQNVISSASGQLDWLPDVNIKRVLSGAGSFDVNKDAKKGGLSVFFCVPEKESATYPRFSRFFWSSIINALYCPPKAPVLLVIDEAASSLESATDLMSTAFSLGGGFGLRMHLLYQNLEQHNTLFKGHANSMFSAASTHQFFGPINDPVTAKYLVERTGHHTVNLWQENFTTSTSAGPDGRATSSNSRSWHLQPYDRPILTEQKLREMSPSKQMLWFEGVGAPEIALRKRYWLTEWADRFDDNPLVTKTKKGGTG